MKETEAKTKRYKVKPESRLLSTIYLFEILHKFTHLNTFIRFCFLFDRLELQFADDNCSPKLHLLCHFLSHTLFLSHSLPPPHLVKIARIPLLL